MYKPLIVAVLAVALAGCGAQIDRVEWPVMGTVAAVQMRGDGDIRAARDICQAEFNRVVESFNAHDPSSRISRFAAMSDDEGEKVWDGWELECVSAALRFRDESGGAFNPRWRGPSSLDLGAIAKGFAVDLAAEAIASKEADDTDILIDLGGNLKSVRGVWRVGVKEPEGDGFVASVKLAPGEALATSAEYYRGKHIYDGRTGKPAESGVKSVTVLCRSGMLADGLSTTLFVLGPGDGLRLIEKHGYECSVLFIMNDGRCVFNDARFLRD